MAANCVGAHQPERLGRDGGVHRHDVGLGQQVVEAVGGVVGERVAGDHAHAEALEAPAGGPADGAQPDEAGGAAGELPAAEALVGDRAVAVHLALAHVAVGGDEVAGDGEQEADGELGHAVGVAPGRPQHGDALGGGAGEVDVGGVAAGRADGDEREVEHRAAALVGLADEDRGAELGGACGELLLVVEAERLLVDPRVDDELAELLAGRRPRARGAARWRR